MNPQCALYLFPVNISNAPFADVLPSLNFEILKGIRHFIVENIRTARRFIKKCDPSANISAITFYELNFHTPQEVIASYLNPLREGSPVGLMSEAGCPGVADPGALIVRIAQEEGLKVVPLIGPSSILLSLMASGLNGQNFSFHGYLPVDSAERERRIRTLESQSLQHDVTQIFIETPYRNDKMLESLLKTLRNDTLLCVARGVTDPENECIITRSVGKWKESNFRIDKVPTVFLFYSHNPVKRRIDCHGKKENII